MERNEMYDIASMYFDVDSLTSGFVAPIINPVREKASLLNHAVRNRLVKERPLCKEAARILADQCKLAKTELPADWDSDENILQCILEVDRSSSPGFPFLMYEPNSNNGDIIDKYGTEYLTRKVRECLDSPKQHDTRVFLKCEPHKKKKVDNDMQRIISSIGLIEQIADRLLYRWLKVNLDESYPYIPVATGWSDKNGKFAEMLELFPREKEILDLDKETWDVTVTELTLVMLRYFLEFMHISRDPDALARWIKCVGNRMHAMYGPGHIFHCSDGSLYVQMFWGWWKSGGFLTLHGNAIMNACLDILAKLELGYTKREIDSELMRAFGDDTIQTKPLKVELSAYLNKLKELGARINPDDVGVGIGVVDRKFCGHKVVETTVAGRRTFGLVPDRLGKHLINLVTAKSDTVFDTLQSMKLNWVTDQSMWDKLNAMSWHWIDKLPDGIKWKSRIRSRAEDIAIAYGYKSSGL